jgi:hypothetical protein
VRRVLSATVVMAVVFAGPLHAQFVRVQPEPTSWFSLGVGAWNAGELADGKTGTTWDFGNRTSPQYRLSLEKALRGSIAVGLSGTYVSAPLHYQAEAGADAGTLALCASCMADVDVYSLYAMFHSGGGNGFHQVVEGGLGVTSYQNFRRQSDGEKLPPLDAERDFAFVFAYGFGYSFSPRAAINLVQEYGFNFHESRGAPSTASNTLRFSNTRLGLRLGMGAQQPARRPGRR